MESEERARGLAAYSAIGEVGRNNGEIRFGFPWPPPLLNLPPQPLTAKSLIEPCAKKPPFMKRAEKKERRGQAAGVVRRSAPLIAE